MAYLSLCVANVQIFKNKIVRRLYFSFPGELRYHTERHSATVVRKFNDVFGTLFPFQMNEEQLQLAVGYVKRSLSSDLTDSMALAK